MYVSCPQCESTYQVSDQFEGKTLKCAGCETAFRARISRAAIKTETSSSPSGNWPTKIPTLSPTVIKHRSPKTVIIAGSIACVIALIAFVACMIYVYRANSPDNLLLDREHRDTSTANEIR